jgi:hypothetical protein
MHALFEKGREGFLDGTLDWDTQTFSAALLDLSTATDVGVKAITSSTNATPIVITSTAHGFTNGDLVFIDNHATNTSANGFWKIANVASNTFELTNPVSGANAVGNGVGGATGYCVNYGPSASGDNWDDFDGCLVGGGAGKVNLTAPTVVAGVADAADTTFTAISGASVEAVAILRDTGVTTTSRMVTLLTGKFIVTADATLTAGTVLVVEPLPYGIPNGTVLAFSTGQSATLTALANAGDRQLTVSSTTVTSGARALAPQTASGIPVTPNGGNIVVTYDNGVNKIFKL